MGGLVFILSSLLWEAIGRHHLKNGNEDAIEKLLYFSAKQKTLSRLSLTVDTYAKKSITPV